MKKKIIGICISIFLISIALPTASAVAVIGTIESNSHVVPRDNHYPIIQNDVTVKSTNDFIIDVIEQMNETLYLGYLENITAFGPRVTGTSSCHEAGEYIYDEFEGMGLEVRYHYWSYGGYSDRNIEATLVGINETSDAKYIICGHYDTVANCPGADDDASGVATVLSAAYILRQYNFNHTIHFIAFSGEEQWMLGSHEYAREAYENGDNIIAVLNVDMIGFAITSTHGSKIKVYKNDASKWLSDLTINISQEYYDYILLDVISLGEEPSDQLYFWEYGYDGLFYHEYEFNYYYHTPQDTIENMNITYGTKCSKLILATLAKLLEFVLPANLHCEGILIWENVTINSVLQGSFEIENIGGSGTLLDWNIVQKPWWGEWVIDPMTGSDLKPGIPFIVNVTVVAPEEKNEVFTGKIKIQNKNDAKDSCTIDVKLSTPKINSYSYNLPFICWLLERFPNAFPILRQLLGL